MDDEFKQIDSLENYTAQKLQLPECKQQQQQIWRSNLLLKMSILHVSVAAVRGLNGFCLGRGVGGQLLFNFTTEQRNIR